MTAASIIDTAQDVTLFLPALKLAGVKTIFGYLDPIGPDNDKVVTPARAKAIGATGLKLGLVNEGWGDFVHGGISAAAGERDASYVRQAASSLGLPTSAAIYFAVDTDALPWQIDKLVLPYFTAIQKEQLPYRIGAYGSGAVCSAVKTAGLASLTWLSGAMGWSGSEAYYDSNLWTIRQGLPTRIANVLCDPNWASSDDIGDFVPFGEN